MTWDTMEMPILRAIDVLQAPGQRPSDGDVAEHVGIDLDVVRDRLDRLIKAGYVQGMDVGTMQERLAWNELSLLERGLVRVGAWPDDRQAVTVIVRVLGEVADEIEEDDPEEAGRLRKAGAALGAMATDVATRVGSRLAADQLGGMLPPA